MPKLKYVHISSGDTNTDSCSVAWKFTCLAIVFKKERPDQRTAEIELSVKKGGKDGRCTRLGQRIVMHVSAALRVSQVLYPCQQLIIFQMMVKKTERWFLCFFSGHANSSLGILVSSGLIS